MIRALAAGAAVIGSLQAVLALAASVSSSEIATLPTSTQATWFVPAKSGRIAAAICKDGRLLQWSLPDGQVKRVIETDIRNVDYMAMSADGRHVAIGDHSGTYSVWDTTSGTLQMKWQLPTYAAYLGFSADGKRLAIAPTGAPVQLFDLSTTRKLLALENPTGGTVAVGFSRDSRYLATADSDTVVRIYDAQNGRLLARNSDFLLEPFTLDFAADGKHLLVGGADKLIVVLDAATGRRGRASATTVEPAGHLEVSPDGVRAAAMLIHADNDSLPAPVLILNVDSLRSLQEWMPPSIAIGHGWTRNGDFLVATATATAVHIWRMP